jgi:hypothetical protein
MALAQRSTALEERRRSAQAVRSSRKRSARLDLDLEALERLCLGAHRAMVDVDDH